MRTRLRLSWPRRWNRSSTTRTSRRRRGLRHQPRSRAADAVRSSASSSLPVTRVLGPERAALIRLLPAVIAPLELVFVREEPVLPLDVVVTRSADLCVRETVPDRNLSDDKRVGIESEELQ